MPITGRVTGKQATKATFAAMPEVVRNRHGEAVRTTASEVVRNARANVRVGHGTLRDHIDFSFSPAAVRVKVGITPGTVVIRESSRGAVTIRELTKGNNTSARAAAFRAVGYKTYRASHYAHLVEFGHGGPHGAPAHPFMDPAFRGQQAPYEDRMRAAQRATVDDLAHVGARYV